MLVVDANAAIQLIASGARVETLPEGPLAAPPLMWSEARSVLRLSVHKRITTPDRGRELLARLEGAAIERRDDERLGFEAWSIAERLGWGRTYDAEYLALATLLDCRLVTEDRRLRRGAERLGLVIGLDELDR